MPYGCSEEEFEGEIKKNENKASNDTESAS
jgi:hypothetical protein